MTRAANLPASRVRPARTSRHAAVAPLATLGATLLVLAAGGCAAVNKEAVKEHQSSGVTRSYDRPGTDLYAASVASIDEIRSTSTYWNRLAIVEQDPAKGTVIAEQSLESAVIPGLGTRDAIGIFVKDVPPNDSDVTVVVLGSDQIPGSAGTSASSWPTASSTVFPAIDTALEAIPVTPRTATTPSVQPAPPAQPAPARSRLDTPPPSAPVAVPVPAPAAASAAMPATVLDRVYDVLRASGSWRPLVRETRVDGTEEVRVGSWASLTDDGTGRVRLTVLSASASAADAARLALELSQAGFAVTVDSDVPKHRAR